MGLEKLNLACLNHFSINNATKPSKVVSIDPYKLSNLLFFEG